MQTQDANIDKVFKIGSVSRLTGLSTHTLRKWESRYGAVTPTRSERGERFYTREDLERLSLLKRLVDAGTAPSGVARLSLPDLKRRAEQLEAIEHVAAEGERAPVSVAVVGDVLTALFERESAPGHVIRVVASADSAAGLLARGEFDPVDVLLLECATVSNETRQTVEALSREIGAEAVVVVYNFSTEHALATLRSAKVVAVRAPADIRVLELLLMRLVRLQSPVRGPSRDSSPAIIGPEGVTAPRLSREMIARLTRATPKTLCECPHHLADLVLSLRAFEEYSEACASRSPEDAALHHYLWRSAARARALFEEAVERVAEAEGINLRD